MRYAICIMCLFALSGCVENDNLKEESKTEAPPATGAAECRRAKGPIKIDGVADEDAWKGAQLIDSFAVHWQRRKPKTATKARLLWDDDNLYFTAEMEDADLYADVKGHNGMPWLNDVFELFFKPADDKLTYYEFQVNAANAQSAEC